MPMDLSLKQIFDKIRHQQALRGIDFISMTDKERKAYASECALALFVEVGELTSSWPFASWKTSPTDIPNIEREINDILFFAIDIAMCFNITEIDLAARFEWVLKNNYDRIHSGEHKTVKEAPIQDNQNEKT